MTLNEAKQKAYGAAHQSAHQTGLLLRPEATTEDAAELIRMAQVLSGAALEIKARLEGVPEPEVGEPRRKNKTKP